MGDRILVDKVFINSFGKKSYRFLIKPNVVGEEVNIRAVD